MRIRLHKRSDRLHVLETVRADGASESVECETRSYLTHDLLHYAVEAEAGLEGGFWGSLAAGRTLAEMNDRTCAGGGPDMAMIETLVGAMTAAAKGASGDVICGGLRGNADALSFELPAWLSPAFVDAVAERMRALQGRWRATQFGAALELEWPPATPR